MKSNTPSFTRRDFQFLADWLKEQQVREPQTAFYSGKKEQWEEMVLTLTAKLPATNPNFNKSKFLEAAGFKED